jgi:hypothetical protein
VKTTGIARQCETGRVESRHFASQATGKASDSRRDPELSRAIRFGALSLCHSVLYFHVRTRPSDTSCELCVHVHRTRALHVKTTSGAQRNENAYLSLPCDAVHRPYSCHASCAVTCKGLHTANGNGANRNYSRKVGPSACHRCRIGHDSPCLSTRFWPTLAHSGPLAAMRSRLLAATAELATIRASFRPQSVPLSATKCHFSATLRSAGADYTMPTTRPPFYASKVDTPMGTRFDNPIPTTQR